MSGTTSYTIKRVLVSALSDAPGLAGVSVVYAPGRDLDLEMVYPGRVRGQQRLLAFREPTSRRMLRREELTVDLHVRVDARSEDVEAAEVRAVEIGAAIEELIASDSTLNTGGVLLVQTATTDLRGDADDDGAYALLTYTLGILSTLT